MKNLRSICVTTSSVRSAFALQCALMQLLAKRGINTPCDLPILSRKGEVTKSFSFEADDDNIGEVGHVLSVLPPPSIVLSGTMTKVMTQLIAKLAELPKRKRYITVGWSSGDVHYEEVYTDLPQELKAS